MDKWENKTFKCDVRIPQVGWNSVSICKNNLLISKQDLSNYRNEFYFVHSYHVELSDINDGLFETKYSDKIFYSGFCKENIFECNSSRKELRYWNYLNIKLY